MNEALHTAIEQRHRKLEQTHAPTGRFGLAALQLVMVSAAYRAADLEALRALATDLRDHNLATIRLARRHADVFHPNVIRSRQAENRELDAILRLIGTLSRSEAA